MKNGLIPYCTKIGIVGQDTKAEVRRKCLSYINRLLDQFLTHQASSLSLSGGYPGYQDPDSIMQLYTFGSFRLGVHSSESDIDCLAVGPSFLARSIFFSEFPAFLKGEHQSATDALDDVSEHELLPKPTSVRSIEEAYVPLICFEIGGIDFDLLYCRTSLPRVTAAFDVLADLDLICGDLDELSLRSINGAVTTERILAYISELLPGQRDQLLSLYQALLRCLKVWARRRGIYSNVLGYVGGVSFSLLAAHAFQRHFSQKEESNTKRVKLILPSIDELFFLCMELFSEWAWPTPVQLLPASKLPFHHSSWNPRKNYRDRLDHMPILTPTSPIINSTHNVFSSTKTVFVGELKRATLLLRAGGFAERTWEEVFKLSSFFERYKVFLCVRVHAEQEGDEKEVNLKVVKIKARLLFNALNKMMGLTAVPHCESIEVEESKGGGEVLVCALKIAKQETANRKTVKIASQITEFKNLVNESLGDSVRIEVNTYKRTEMAELLGLKKPENRYSDYVNEMIKLKKIKMDTEEKENLNNNAMDKSIDDTVKMDGKLVEPDPLVGNTDIQPKKSENTNMKTIREIIEQKTVKTTQVIDTDNIMDFSSNQKKIYKFCRANKSFSQFIKL